MRSALDVANHFVEYSRYSKTPLQIQKLTYIAHGYMLGVDDEALTSEEPEAWDHGPVFSNVFREFKKWKFNPIGAVKYSPEPFTPTQYGILNNVFAYYGRFCGYFLSEITHGNSDEPTPWQRCYIPGAKHIRIPNDITQKYYKQLYEKRGYEY